MSEKDNNLTPWQQKNREYQKQKNSEKSKNSIPKRLEVTKFFNENLEDETDKANIEPEFDGEEIVESPIAMDEGDFSEETEAAETLEETEDYEAAYNKFKAQNVSLESEEELPKKMRDPLSPVLKKMWIPLLIAFVVFIGAAYEVSPLSKIGAFSVTGNAHENAQQVADASTLKTGDTVFNILHNKNKIEQKIESQFPRISSVKLVYHFPNKFEAAITEHKNAVYVQQGKQVFLVLDNGYIVRDQKVDTKHLEKMPVLMFFTDGETKEFVQAYESLTPSLQALITTVTKTPTDATKDFIALDMRDGNQVRVPLSEMSDKLPYYPSIAKQITAPQVVDMEAGIYAKSKAAYQQDLSTLASQKAASISASKTQAENASSAAANSTTASSN
jgi:cell division protein FtsQ